MLLEQRNLALAGQVDQLHKLARPAAVFPRPMDGRQFSGDLCKNAGWDQHAEVCDTQRANRSSVIDLGRVGA